MEFEIKGLPGVVMFDSRKHTRKRPRMVQDTTSVRRHKEAQTIYSIAKYIPMDESQLERANQPIVLRLAVQYVKLRKLLQENLLRDHDFFRCSPQFHGFFLVIDMMGTIVYASSNITTLLGPHLIDVIGQDFLELLHAEDRSVLKDLEVRTEDDIPKLREHTPTVLRMKTNMSPTVRSQAKIQYKNVLVTSQFKRFKFQPCDAEPGDQYTSSSILCLAMCRTEELIGIPEIVLNGNFDVFVNSSHEILDMDWKSQWFTGYKLDMARNSCCSAFTHPSDLPDDNKSVIVERNKTLFSNGVVVRKPYRIITAWGQWIWIQTTLTLPSKDDTGDRKRLIRCSNRIFGPDDGTAPMDEPKIVKKEPEEFCCQSSCEDFYSSSWRNASATSSPRKTVLEPIHSTNGLENTYHYMPEEQESDQLFNYYASNSSPSNASLTGSLSSSSSMSEQSFEPHPYTSQDISQSYPHHPSRSMVDSRCSSMQQMSLIASLSHYPTSTAIGTIH